MKRKKGAPKWKRVEAEIDTMIKRIEKETPPSGVLYYKYKASSTGEEEEQKTTVANRKIQETSDKDKIKIRFTDLPISKATIYGLFKANFVKMTETQRASLPH